MRKINYAQELILLLCKRINDYFNYDETEIVVRDDDDDDVVDEADVAEQATAVMMHGTVWCGAGRILIINIIHDDLMCSLHTATSEHKCSCSQHTTETHRIGRI